MMDLNGVLLYSLCPSRIGCPDYCSPTPVDIISDLEYLVKRYGAMQLLQTFPRVQAARRICEAPQTSQGSGGFKLQL